MENTIPINRFYQKANNSIAEKIQNFQKFLLQLLNAGANANEVAELQNYVHSEVEKGNDPKFKPTKTGVFVNNRFFSFYNGLNGGFDSYVDNVAARTGDPYVQAISALVDFDKLVDNFSNIFANGFNLSCWGASYSKSQARKDIAVDFPFMLKWSGIDKGVSEQSLNKFSMLIDSYLGGAKNGTNRVFAKCTRDAYQLVFEKGTEFKNEMFKLIRKNPSITFKPLRTSKGSGSINYPGLSSHKGPHNLGVWPITIYDVQVSRSINQQLNNNNGEPLSNSNNNTKPKVSTSSFGGLALASLALFAIVKLSSEESNKEKEILKTA